MTPRSHRRAAVRTVACLAALSTVGAGLMATAASASPQPAASGATENAAGATPLFPVAGQASLRRVVLEAPRMTITRSGAVVRLGLPHVSPNFSVVTTRHKTARRGVGTYVLPRWWSAALGFNPTVSLSYTIKGKRRTHVLQGGVLPKYAKGTLSMQFIGNAQNQAVISRMRPSAARDVTVTLLPTPAGAPENANPGSFDPGVKATKSQAQSTTTDNPYPPPGANRPYTLPYMSGLGPPWYGYLSATGQSAASCVSYPTAGRPSGAGGTSGVIYVYQSSAEAQQSLNIGGSISGDLGKVSATLSGAYSTDRTQSTSSVYAIAIVNFKGGTVDLGNGAKPALTSGYASSAGQATTFNDALAFMQLCGDSYAASYGVGATWISVLEIKTASQSAAQSLAVSLDASYKDYSGAVDFSGDVSRATSSAQILETDQCWGPSGCFSIPGYAASASTNMTTALNQFTANFSAMLGGLPGACPTNQCITSVNYRPISELMSGASAPYMQQAAYGVFGVAQNLNAWHSQYQAINTAAPSSSWTAPISNLNNQGNACTLAYLSTNSGCVTRFNQCYTSSLTTFSYLNKQCLPAAFSTNGLLGLADPFVLSGAYEPNLAGH